MNLFYAFSLICLIGFAGVSVDIYRKVRKREEKGVFVPDDPSLDLEANRHFDAEEEREGEYNWQAPDFLKKDEVSREVPKKLGEIVYAESYLTEATTPLIVCPPSLDGMLGAAMLLRRIPWAHVRVINKNFFVKSIFKLTRMKPAPDHIIIVGMESGYVHGRRFIQTFQRVCEQGIKIAWYDNHRWLPIIARNISELCFDFLIVKPDVPVPQLMCKRFCRENDAVAQRIGRIFDSYPQHNEGFDAWTLNWRDLLLYAVHDGKSVLRQRLVKRLSKAARISPLDRLFISRYKKRYALTKRILREQQHFIELSGGRIMSVLDLRKVHREQASDGKTYFVFRGEQPTFDLTHFAFQDHNCDALFIIHSFKKCEIFSRDETKTKLSRLIDLTWIGDSSIRVDGRDGHVTIFFDIPWKRRMKAIWLFRWPDELPLLFKKIVERL